MKGMGREGQGREFAPPNVHDRLTPLASLQMIYLNCICKDMNSFWRSWKSKNNSNHPFSTDIEWLTGDCDIANRFAEYFSECTSGDYEILDHNCPKTGTQYKPNRVLKMLTESLEIT